MAPEILFPLLGLLLILLGWPLASRRIRPNRWYGLRVPATFADRQVWYDANGILGRDMMMLGAAFTIIALALPIAFGLRGSSYSGACAAVLGGTSLILVVRGWRVANRLLRERRDSKAPQR